MDYNKNLFLSNLNSLMKEQGIKITELEAECGLSQGYFARFKSLDNNVAPSVGILIKLCEVFNVSINILLFSDYMALSSHEKAVINFIEKISKDTYEFKVSWKLYDLFSSKEEVLNSGIIPLYKPKDLNNGYSYISSFDNSRYMDNNSKIYVLKNNSGYYILCYINVRECCETLKPKTVLELYYIKDNVVHPIVDSEITNEYIKEELNILYRSINREIDSVKLDKETLDAISKY